ncbi:MAG: HU family DNA-binding protein [Bacteroidaceae bacterium]|jgi:DNA-binding protein HU-beta|nr:HU family DNA-binding protein [Bacteroidaceae bacterium]
MNNKEFLSALSAKTGYNTKETGLMVRDVISVLTGELTEENTVGITGFGTFEVKKKLERVLVNPSTKQRMLVPPKMVVSFKPNSGMKDKVNGK